MAELSVAFVAPEELEQQARDWATCLGECSLGVSRIFMPDNTTVRVRLKNGMTWEIKTVPWPTGSKYWDDGAQLKINVLV